MKWAFLWSAVRNWSPRIGTILTFLIVARLLEPGEIGAFAAAMAVVAFIELVSDAGLADAVVQARRKSRATLTAVWAANLALSMVVLLLLLVLAQPIADALQSPSSGDYIRALAFVVPLNALGFIPVALLRRSYGFRRLAVRSTIATLISCTLGISLAFAGFGAWSMVFQALAFAVINLTLVLIPPVFRPRRPSFSTIGPLVRFGFHVFVSRFLYFASTRAMELAIPVVFGAASLGIYFMASRVPAVCAQIVSGVMIDVNLPRFARARGDLDELRGIVRRSMTMTSALAAPVFFGLAATAPELSVLFFGEKGHDVAPVMLPISMVCGIQAIGFYNQLILNSQDRSGLAMKLSAMNAVVTVLYFAVGSMLPTLEAFIYGFGMLQVAMIVLVSFVVNRVTDLGLGSIMRDGLPFYGAAVLATVAARILGVEIFEPATSHVFVRAVLVGGTFAVTYAATLMLVHRRTAMRIYLFDLAGLKRFKAADEQVG